MKRSMIGLSLLLSNTALGVATPIKSLITGSGGQMTVSADTFVVSKRTTAGTYLLLGIGQATSYNGRINGLSVLALHEYLTPPERDLFAKNVVRVALTCFNLLPARQNAITAWLNVQSKSTSRVASSDFGPMTLTFSRALTDSGQFYTAAFMTRTGQPGVVPWGNYCVQ